MLKETYTLNNGVAIPKLGLGTWFIDDAKAADAVKEALKNFKKIESYGASSGFTVYGGRI